MTNLWNFSPFILAAKGDGPPVTPAAQDVWVLFGVLPITNSNIAAVMVAVVLAVIAWFATRNIQMVPNGLQNFVEFIVETLENTMSELLEPKVVRWVFPFIATFFIFILASNLSALFPGVGSVGYVSEPEGTILGGLLALGYVDLPLYRPATADANMTAAMAVIFFFACWYWTFRYNGFVGTIDHIFGVKGGFKGIAWVLLLPIFLFIGVLEMVSITIRPVALAARLYGNIYGGENVLTIMLTLNDPESGGWLAILFNCMSALPFYFLEILVATVQTLVFALLCLAFTTSLCSHMGGDDHDDEHGKEAAAH